jgi:hypothetical protein
VLFKESQVTVRKVTYKVRQPPPTKRGQDSLQSEISKYVLGLGQEERCCRMAEPTEGWS